MSGDQHEADLERVSNQNSFADIARVVEQPQGGLFTEMITAPLRAVVGSTGQGQAVFGSTDFDQKDLDLNQMLDMVERTDPEDLESSGKALWDARDAIKAAADELDGRITRLSWKGQAGSDFRGYGALLVTATQELSNFAGSAGDQITAAAVGLASVRSAMPPRDPNNRKRPKNFTETERAADDKEYAAAVKVEKDRQEAINQMNRLASYYAVSSQQLQVLQEKPPTFPDMPNVGVPRPERLRGGPGETGPAVVTNRDDGATQPPPVRNDPPDVINAQRPQPDVNGRVTHPDDPARPDIPPTRPDVNTELDTVGTVPPPTSTPPNGPTPPVTGGPPPNGQPGPFPGGPPVANLFSGRNQGSTSGQRAPLTAQGRTRPGVDPVTGRPTGTGGGNAMGRPTPTGGTNQAGRSTPTGQPGARGTGPGGRPYPMGSQGVTGGTPRPGGTQGQRTAGTPPTGAGRNNGVVGGRPANAGGTPARGGAKIPRGTVIGTGGTSASRPAARQQPGQRGVVGASQPAPRTGGRGSSPSVTGNPAGRNSPANAERNGMTRGGAGLVRGLFRRNRRRDDDQEREENRRPDDPTGNEETEQPDRPRRDVPPAAN
ncbi:hypothetical protein AB0D49_19960 [Streptomyces sp. NPDC048290]|uniref:WXG100 family type VII secretion target n=1 Tax=Streptomyces sp. NPDC048290 TaxID=3155811 RepID=UPI00343F649E